MTQISPEIILAVVIGLTEVFKVMFDFPKRSLPFIAVITGIVMTFVANAGISWAFVLQGTIIGLFSVGLYSATTVGILGKGLSEKLGISRKD